MNGNDEMRRLFQEAGLGSPPVPAEMVSLVEQRGPWAFATRDINPMGMYMFQDYVFEVLTGPVDDYMAVSHAGHGANSYAISYHLVMGPLAVFAQTGWGGVYMDKEKSTADVRNLLNHCAELLDALQNSSLPAQRHDGRLVVAESTLRRSFCRWLDAPLTDKDAIWPWLDETPRYKQTPGGPHPALTQATHLLRTGQIPPN
ncbi:hypothetical protein [Actinomadura vinacea]